jgi:hypothetical protein
MDQHPIPQDVTGFQFKLIGTMTVKQFGYVASGVIAAVVLYYFPLHSAFGIFLKVILVPLFGVSGVIVAFVPLDGRPIDIMATNFVKALFSPNQYIYHRQGHKLSFSIVAVVKVPASKKAQQQQQKGQKHNPTSNAHVDEKEEKLRAFLLSSHGNAKSDLDKKEAAFLNALTLPSTAPATATTAIPQNTPLAATPLVTKPALPPISTKLQLPVSLFKPVMQPLPPTPLHETPQTQEELSQKEKELSQALSQAKQEETTNQTPALHIATEQKVTTLSKQIEEIHTQKQKLEQELSHLKTQLATQKVPTTTGNPITASAASPTPPQPLQDPQHVRTIPQGVTKKVGLPSISDSPNVVVGIVKDPRGNILPNILVEVKDKDGNPVRAFKTNQLGQFASATPLSPGMYTIELDDPKKLHRFDTIQITANNQVLLPIEIISHDAREELRKQLFAN